MKRKGFLCILISIMCITASGCQKNSNNKAETSTASTVNTETSFAAENKDESEKEEDKNDESSEPIDTIYYEVDGYNSALEVPSNYEMSGDNSVSGNLDFKAPDDSGNRITINVLDAMDEETFEKFDESQMAHFAESSLSECEQFSFEEATLTNVYDDVEIESYFGAYTGKYEGEDVSVYILAAICQDKEQMTMVSVLDQDGSLENYSKSLENYLYINENGFVVENNKLEAAPEPEDIHFENDEAGYTIELPAEWTQITDEAEKNELSNTIASFDTADVFESKDGDVLLVGTSQGTTDDAFYASIDQQKKWFEAGGNEVVSSKKCNVGDHAAYQVVLTRSIGPAKLRTTVWLINRSGEEPVLFSYALYDLSGKKSDFSSSMIDNITIE